MVQLTLKVVDENRKRHFDMVSIVVTHNRKQLLLNCIDLLLRQTIKTDILIVDNASNDCSLDKLRSIGILDDDRVHYIYLNKNVGGAGGFHHGLKYAYKKGWQWFWLMDDDAEPHIDALEKLMDRARDKNHIYGSVSVSNEKESAKLCFPTKKIIAGKFILAEDINELDTKNQVVWLPFLGFLISKQIVHKLGLPDHTMFIRNDDIEYSERANQHGIKLFLIKGSIIKHPYQPTISFVLFGRRLYYRSMPPWKMYYEIRNKIIIAKKYYSLPSSVKSLGGASLQVLMSLLIENEKKDYLLSYLKGFLDGIRAK